MKLIVTILLLTISILTVAPVSEIYSSNEQCNEGCCSNDNSEGQKGPDCCPGICNPFQICSCCVALPLDNNGFQFNLYLTEIKNKSTADKFILSDFTKDCWQPPETVV